MLHRHHIDTREPPEAGRRIRVALVGNANVGKSVIFNRLTDSYQLIGNWPGKTVERAKGFSRIDGYILEIVDLPGIYSFTTFSEEEAISRRYIAYEKPDVIVNVVDATVLERNLYFTLQLIDMGIPLILCLNQMDMAKRKGIEIDVGLLSQLLGIPVIPTVAIKGEGIYDLAREIIKIFNAWERGVKPRIRYSPPIEDAISQLTRIISDVSGKIPYPPRFIAIKILEGDDEIEGLVKPLLGDKYVEVEGIRRRLEERFRHPLYLVIASERYRIIVNILNRVLTLKPVRRGLGEWVDYITTHRVFGYVSALGSLLILILWTFIVGNYLSDILGGVLEVFGPADPLLEGELIDVIWSGVYSSIIAGVTLVIPFVIPFYLLLSIFEDSGLLTRIAFVIDGLMHRIRLHGKAIIPLILGYGCNVPAIYSTRILDDRWQRLLSSLLITMIPCAARAIIILGLVSIYLGIEWAIALYFLDLLIVFIVGKLYSMAVGGEPTGLIMEIHPFRVPSIYVVLRQTWARTKYIIYIVFPLYILGTLIVQILYVYGLLNPLIWLAEPFTRLLFDIPGYLAILLVFGFVRKELILILLPVFTGGWDLLTYFTPIQLFTLALVATLYIPCLATIASLIDEFGSRDALIITLLNILTAIFFGSIIYHLLSAIL